MNEKKSISILSVLLVSVLCLTCCPVTGAPADDGSPQPSILDAVALTVRSNAFTNYGVIPLKYSCKGIDISPQLSWSKVPAGTKSLALLVDDPDAPGGTWTHWIAYNIPKTRSSLAQNVPRVAKLPDGTKQGRNDFGTIGYRGPCPPPGGSHRYFFRVYALDKTLTFGSTPGRAQFLNAIKGHVLRKGTLVGKFP